MKIPKKDLGKLKRIIIEELMREAAKRRPDGWLPSTAKNLHLDKPFSAGGWPEGEYDPPVNVQIKKYFKDLGLLEEE